MKNTIIIWTMMVLLSFLTACGGSDSSEDSNFTKSDTTTDDTTDDDTTDDDTTDDDQPDTVIEDNVIVALGIGSGASFQSGVIKTGIDSTETLSASGSTTLSVNLVDANSDNAQFEGLREISFVSTCSSAGLAKFTPEKIKASVVATVTYKDLGCGKELGVTDNIVAYIEGETDTNQYATARTSLDVAAAKIGAIQYVSAEPSLIALSGYGTGTVPSLSNVIFQVVDRSGNPMPDRTVKFELDHEYGGAELSLDKAITDADGTVNVILNAGAAAGTIRVKASIDVLDADGVFEKSISTLSVPITMATSLGDQNSFSLSATPFNPNAWSKDGTSVQLSVRLGDHNQNPVIDGTRVYFRATGGMVDPSCETASGVCTVNWQSSNPRPIDGHVTVVAFTRGQSDYQDANSNGLFDLGESFTAFGESYIDANGNGEFEVDGAYQPDVDIDGDGTPEFGWSPTGYQVYVDSTGTPTYAIDSANFFEEFVDSNNNGVIDLTPETKYQGVNCSADAISGGHCAEQINLVDSVRLEMSDGESALIEGPFAWDDALGRYNTDEVLSCIDGSARAQDIAWRIADSEERRNHLPSGSSISVVLDDTQTESTSGDGTVQSVRPAKAWPLWSNLTENVLKTDTVKKYDYLNARGHLVTANVIRADSFTTFSWLGKVGVRVDTAEGASISGGFADVDLKGYEAKLTDGNTVLSSIDVSTGARTYKLTFSNTCNVGLPEASVLSIGFNNGVLSGVSVGGNAASHNWVSGNSFQVTIGADETFTEVNFTLSDDGDIGEDLDGLTLEFEEQVKGKPNTTTIIGYAVNG